MAKAYSIDLRERVVATYENERKSIREVAKLFKVSKNFVFNLLKRVRETGHVAPKPHGGGHDCERGRRKISQTIT